MVRILALLNLKLWFTDKYWHFVSVEKDIWNILDDDDDEVFIEKNQTQQQWVFTVQIMDKRDNLISKTRYKKK